LVVSHMAKQESGLADSTRQWVTTDRNPISVVAYHTHILPAMTRTVTLIAHQRHLGASDIAPRLFDSIS